MKKLLLLGILGFLTACGSGSDIDFSSAVPDGCTQEQVSGGTEITCGDETVLIQNGQDGLNGSDGAKGDKGETGATGSTGLTGATGAKGDKGDTGATGSAGANGLNGKDGADGADGKSCKVVSVPKGAQIECEDGTTALIEDGADGAKGADGKDAVIYTSVKAPKNSCTQVGSNLWVENIQNGRVFDVYSNNKCADAQGEYCDNVLASFGDSGSVDETEHAGSGTTCWANNVQVQGHKLSNGDIIIKIMDFN